MIGRNFASLFHLYFGSGRHFAGLDVDDDKEVLLMKVLLIIEVVLEVEWLRHIILSILDDADDEEVPFMKVLLIIEVVLVF